MTLKQILMDYNHIVFLGGAGVSTESGIPDFRSDNGIFTTINHYGVSPEKILSSAYFWSHTETFYDYYRQAIVHPSVKPNDAHIALAKLEKMGKLDGVITQNIDGLHQMAGSEGVLELHGSIHRNYCSHCGKFYNLEQILEMTGVPKCTDCGRIIKPDVILYEEPLDNNIYEESYRWVRQAEILIVGGTSLNVYPAAGLLDCFRGKHVVLINKGRTPVDTSVDLLIRESIGKVLKEAVSEIQGEI
jgi:NAD-dependent deacetylase